jgi:hypothetical protein
MDFNNYAVYKALEGASTFGETYAGSFLPESEGAKDFAKLDPLLKNIGNPRRIQRIRQPSSKALAQLI